MGKAGSVLRLISSNGTVEYTIDVIPATITNTVIWAGEFAVGNWSEGNQDLAWGGYNWSSIDLTVGTISLVFDFTLDTSASWWQFALRHGDKWGDLPENTFFGLTADQTQLVVPLTQTMLDDLIANGGLVMTGCNYILSKVSLRTEISLEVTLWEGSLGPCDWSGTHIVAIPSDKQSQLVPGKTLGVEYECDPSQEYWQLEFMTTWWTQLPAFKENGERKIWDMDPAATKFSKVIAQEDIDLILGQGGLLFCGNGVIVKRVYVL